MARLKFKPTPIARLRKMTVPFKMVGDPEWNWKASGKAAWHSREQAIYKYEMDRKHPGPFSLDTYNQAIRDNYRINLLLARKDPDYDAAYVDAAAYDYDQAVFDNDMWDYEHEYFIDAA